VAWLVAIFTIGATALALYVAVTAAGPKVEKIVYWGLAAILGIQAWLRIDEARDAGKGLEDDYSAGAPAGLIDQYLGSAGAGMVFGGIALLSFGTYLFGGAPMTWLLAAPLFAQVGAAFLLAAWRRKLTRVDHSR
jgi:hypothetical protein